MRSLSCSDQARCLTQVSQRDAADGLHVGREIRAEGREMLDASRLFEHYDPNPTDWHYQPVNVFTHGQLPDGLMHTLRRPATPS